MRARALGGMRRIQMEAAGGTAAAPHVGPPAVMPRCVPVRIGTCPCNAPSQHGSDDWQDVPPDDWQTIFGEHVAPEEGEQAAVPE